MSPPQAHAAEPSQTTPFHRAFNALLNVGRDLLGRIQAAITHNDSAYLPRRFARAPQSAERRIANTLDWIVALARTLAGDTTWLITPSYRFPAWPHRFPPFTAKLREECGLPPVPPRTEAQKAAAHLRYVKKVFATQPVAKIATRLARRLGIKQTADAWPKDLLTITQTPVAWAKSAHAKPPTHHTPPPEPEAATPDPPPPIATGPPALA